MNYSFNHYHLHKIEAINDLYFNVISSKMSNDFEIKQIHSPQETLSNNLLLEGRKNIPYFHSESL